MDDIIIQNLSPLRDNGREKMESIEHIIYDLNKYIRSPEELNESFTVSLTKAIKNLLLNPSIYGQKGDENASDLIFRCVKLFINFSEKKLAVKRAFSKTFFEFIRMIFDKYYEHPFFVTPKDAKDSFKGTHKDLTYEDYNKLYEFEFEIKEKLLSFTDGEDVDVYVMRVKLNEGFERGEWVKGKIVQTDFINKEYTVLYNGNMDGFFPTEKTFPFNSPKMEKCETKTEYLTKKYNFDEEKEVDICIKKDNKKLWYPATIVHIDKPENPENKLMYANYTLEYSDKIFDDDNNKDNIEEESFYGGNEKDDDIIIPFDSYRIQENNFLSRIQKKNFDMIKNEKTKSAKNYEDLLDFIIYFFENDQSIEDFYAYEIKGEEIKLNFVVGKFSKDYSFYFSKLLKSMADNGHFQSFINILKNKPTLEEVKTIFCILINSAPFIHKDYYKINFENFKRAVFDVVENKNENEKNIMTKEDIDNFVFFLIKIQFLISYNGEIFNIKEEIDKLFLTVGLKTMKSNDDKIKKIGLDIILECVDDSLNEKESSFFLSLLNGNENEFLNLLFNKNYKIEFISISDKIFKLMIDNNSLNTEELELIWNLVNENPTDINLENKIIEIFEKLMEKLNKNSDLCKTVLDIILSKDKIQQNDSLYILKNKLALGGKDEKEQLNCCEYFTKQILQEKDLNKLEENYFLKEVIKYFDKNNETFYSSIINQFLDNLKENKNVFITLSAFQKILLEKDNLSICKKFIEKENKKIIELFSVNISKYKDSESKKLSELIKDEKDEKEKNEDYLKELDEHKKNMKIFIDFLMEIIHNLYPKEDYFDLLKKISLKNPVAETDKQIFYDYIKIFIENEKNKEYKLETEGKIFEIIKAEQKDNMTLEQIKIFIKIFLDINTSKEDLIQEGEDFKKRPLSDLQEISGTDGLWDAYFNLKKEELSDELRLFLYKLYKNNVEEQSLLDKCLSEIDHIKDNIENKKKDFNDDNKLVQIINMINYIISETEKGKYINIKSHSDLPKESIMNIPLILYNENSSNEIEEIPNDKKNYFMEILI